MRSDSLTRKFLVASIGFVFLGAGLPVFADVIHEGGTIDEHVTWYAGSNDHIVTGNISIADDASLTIQAGCVVRFENSINMYVYGSLICAGTAADPILMTRNDPDDEWYGLWFYPDSGGLLEYAVIEYVTRYDGYAIYGNQSLPDLEHCTLRYNDYGIFASGVASPTLDVANTITDNNVVGIELVNCSDASISNQTVSGHTGAVGAIYLRQCGSFHIGAGNVVTGNTWGLTVDAESYPGLSSAGNIPLAGNSNDDGIQVRGGSCTGATIWHDVGADFILTSAPNVANGGTLTVDAGVTVRGEDAINLYVYGTLNAEGTVADPVLFTRRHGDDEWYGLWFYPDSGGLLEYAVIEYVTRYDGYAIYGNQSLPDLEHCTLRYNDYGIFASGVASPTLDVANTITDNNVVGIELVNCSDASISNQTVSGHTGAVGAIYLRQCGSFHIGAGNVVTGNTWGLTVDAESYPGLSSAGNIPLAGNSNDDGIQVRGGSCTGATIWHDVGADFILTSAPNVANGGTLTVDAGVTVRGEDAINLYVYGTLNAEGTVADPVLFTRRHGDDEWYGLWFYPNSGGLLEYAVIEYVTRYDGYAIYGNQSLPDLEHCTLRYNDYGIFASGVASPTLDVANTITDNNVVGIELVNCSDASISNQTVSGHTGAVGAIYLRQCGSFHIGAGNVVTGNTWGLTVDAESYPGLSSAGNIPLAGNSNDDGIQVRGGSCTGATIWHDVGADFILTSAPNVANGGTLTVDAGVTVRGEDAINLYVYGTLNAEGTVADPVLFTRRHGDDEWYGLWFYPNSGGLLEYAVIEYVTRYDGYAIYGNQSLPDLEHCTLRYNDYGIFASGVASPTLDVANTITDNNVVGIELVNCSDASISNQTVSGHTGAVGAIYLRQCGSFHIGAGNVVTGNTWGLTVDAESYPGLSSAGNIPLAGNSNDDGIQVRGGSCTGATIWHDVGADFILTSAPNVASDGTLTVDAGVTVRGEDAINLYVYGTLNAEGTVADPVLFTRRHGDDEWYGLWFYPDSGGLLEYATIEYVTRYDGYAIYTQSSDLDLENCVLRYNDYGVRIQDASPHFQNCRIIDNNDYGIHMTGACTPTFGGSLAEWNDIHDNGGELPDRDLHNGTEDINARFVYWGTVVAAEIENRIHHELDDEDLGLVVFGPWTNAAHDEEYEGGPSPVEEGDHDMVPIPTAYGLAQNAPNPFNPLTTIHYDLPQAGSVRLTVYDLAGRRVATLVEGFEEAGYRSVNWDARELGSGVYFYRIEAGEFSEVRKMTLLK